MPSMLAFVNSLGDRLFCCDQLCDCEYFVVHSNGCGGGSMFGNQVHAAEELCQTWELRPCLHESKQRSATQETAQEFAR